MTKVKFFSRRLVLWLGTNSAIGTATHWTVRGSNPARGRDFSHPSKPVLGPTQPPIQLLPGLFPGGKAAGAWR